MKRHQTVTYVGSRLVPWRSNLGLLKQTCHQPLFDATFSGTSDLLEVHNSYTMYCVMLLMSATGHRPVRDPFHSINSFDLERGLLLIEDKEVFPVRGPRLAWMAPMAVEMMRKYLIHLVAVSRKLVLLNHDLATDVNNITLAGSKHRMPLFFLLAKDQKNQLIWESITPAKLTQHLSDWTYPLNTGRHLLAEALRKSLCSAYQVEAHLGHIEAGVDIFSIESTVDTGSVGASIKPLLQAHLETMNWKLLDGFVPSQGIPIIKKTKERTSEIPVFGPRARKQKREVIWKTISKEVDALLGPHLPNGTNQKISDETIDTLRETIMTSYRAKGEGMLIALELLRQKLSKVRRRGVNTKLPGRFVVERTARIPFKPDTIHISTLFLKARRDFDAYLARSCDFSIETRIAEITVSAILWGSITNLHVLNSLPEALKAELSLIDDICSIDISIPFGNTSTHTVRWLPDPISLALIIGLSKYFLPKPSPLNDELIHKKILALVSMLGFYDSKVSRTKIDTASKNALRNLIRAARAHWRVCMPGFLRHFMEGWYHATPLPYWRWATVLSGRRIHNHKIDDKTVLKPSVCIPAITPSSALGCESWDKGQLLWQKLTALIGAKGKNGRSNAHKALMLKSFQRFLQNNTLLTSKTAQLLIAWLIHLCQHGTPTLKSLSANSITAYASTIGRGLLEHGSHLDLLGLSDLDFEDMYFRIVNESTRAGKLYLVGRLREFHRFLIDTLGVPPLDWSEVSDCDTKYGVDAGVVTANEYQHSFDLVREDPSFDERSRLAHCMVLLLAFHFGLRRGEIFRLRVSDILHNERCMVVLVRDSEHGETKSDNGIRQIPLISTLSSTEKEIVKRWFSHATDFVEDNNALVLASLSNPRKPINAISRPVEALRIVTANPQARLRHLRHTFASRLFLSMLPHTEGGLVQRLHKVLWGDVTPEQVRETLVGRNELSPRALYSVAMVMGHGDITTTLTHYTHFLDIALHDWQLSQKFKLSDKALAYAYDLKYANLRKLRERKGRAFDKHMLSIFEKNIIRNVPPDTIAEATESLPLTLPGPNQSKTIIRMSDIDRLMALLGIRTNLDGLADRFLIDDEQVALLQRIARSLQQQTGFSDFGLPLTGADLWVIPHLARDAQLDKEAGRARQHLDSLEARISDRTLSASLTNIWKESFHPNSHSLLIEGPQMLECFFQAAQKMGMEETDFTLTIPKTSKKESGVIFDKLATDLKRRKYVVKRGHLIMSRNPLSPENRVGITLRSGHTKSGYNRTFHRILFVVSVWMTFVQSVDFPDKLNDSVTAS